jgi:hypothetical protein
MAKKTLTQRVDELEKEVLLLKAKLAIVSGIRWQDSEKNAIRSNHLRLAYDGVFDYEQEEELNGHEQTDGRRSKRIWRKGTSWFRRGKN